MVALNHKKEFAPKVEDGSKTHSIRAVRKQGNPTPGCALQHYYGMRTKQCRKLRDSVCTEVIPIKINWDGVRLDGKWIGKGKETFKLALDDGFTSTNAFIAFFDEQPGLPFEGNLIKWRNHKKRILRGPKR